MMKTETTRNGGHDTMGRIVEAYSAILAGLREDAVLKALEDRPAAKEAVRVIMTDAELMRGIANEVGRWQETSRAEVLGLLRTGVGKLEESFSAIAAQDDLE